MDEKERKLMEEQNELLRELVASLKDVKEGRVKRFKE